MSVVTIKESDSQISELLKEAQDEIVKIKQNGKPSGVLLSWDYYESLIETLEILSDPEMMEGIRRGEEDIKAGRVIPWEKAREELGIE